MEYSSIEYMYMDEVIRLLPYVCWYDTESLDCLMVQTRDNTYAFKLCNGVMVNDRVIPYTDTIDIVTSIRDSIVGSIENNK